MHRIRSDWNTYLAEKTKELLKRHRIAPRRRLSQSFAVDKSLLEILVSTAQLQPTDTVLEIGGGLGALTERLADIARRVIVVEIDHALVKVLEELAKNHDNIEVIHADALMMKFPAAEIVASNAPYHISSPLIEKLFQELPQARAVLTLQKEFAQRLAGAPGTRDYGRLTLLAYYHAEVKVLRIFPPSAFFPQPEVDSAVVLFTPRARPPFKIKDQATYFALSKHLFSQRNRKLAKVIRTMAKSSDFLKVEMADRLIEKASFLLDKRVRELTPEQFALLADIIS